MALVSVIIPYYNQARFLGEAIESVLKQSYPHFEVVVVDDGSTDNTTEVASRYARVRCIRQENRGLAGARNEGIRRSVGTYLVFLDADHGLLPGALEAGLRELESHPECAFVSGHCRFIGVDGSTLPTPDPTPVDQDHYTALLHSCYVLTPAVVMYRRTHLEYVRGFDTSVSPSADYDLYLRLSRHYPVHLHREVVAEYPRHGTNATRNPARMLEAESTVLRRQRAFISGTTQRKAYRAGIRHSQEHSGAQLVEETQTRIKEGKWTRTSGDLLRLFLYYRTGLFLVLRGLLFRRAWKASRTKMSY
jgi:glycosyltransferase involved in cell wall biosynthesis